ncbi:MAG: hypothetical protein ACI35O_10180 [Bacillaceae bacterium]
MQELLVFGVIFVMVLMCLHVIVVARKTQLGDHLFLMWLVAVFLTGPIGYLVFLATKKHTRDLEVGKHYEDKKGMEEK